MIKTANLILFAILMLSNLVSVHAQQKDNIRAFLDECIRAGLEHKQNYHKSLVGKWKYSDLKVDVVTSDLETTAKIETIYEILNQKIRSDKKVYMDMELTEDGCSNVARNMKNFLSYSMPGYSLMGGEEGKAESELDIKSDTIILRSDISNKLYDFIVSKNYLDKNLVKMKLEPEYPKDLVIEKCFISVYFTRVKKETEIN